jgi:hypothetical protein
MLLLPSFMFHRNKAIIIIVNLLIVIIFTSIYYKLGTNEHFYFNNEPKQTKLTLLNALYFTFITHFTIGYGDIVPKSNLLRCIIMIQCICMITFLLI